MENRGYLGKIKQANYGTISNKVGLENYVQFRPILDDEEKPGAKSQKGGSPNQDDLVTLKRTVGLFGSIALIVGTQIGTKFYTFSAQFPFHTRTIAQCVTEWILFLQRIWNFRFSGGYFIQCWECVAFPNYLGPFRRTLHDW